MRKRNFKGRCTKRYVHKCTDICRTYDSLQEAYVDVLSQSNDIEEFRCNVYLEGLAEGDYTTDFVCTKTDGTIIVRECIYRSRLIKPMHTFEQLAELGITIVNLPAYRPELKGSVEKFFDTVQSFYKKHLKGKGVIEPDYQERGAHDYRKDACLTMEMFSEVIVRCILHYNTKHVLENYPFTEDMLDAGVKPYANSVWNYGKKLIADTTIAVTKEKLILCLLPRTEAKYTRFGLVVNKMRYHNPAYTEKYLTGGKAVAAYDTESVSYV